MSSIVLFCYRYLFSNVANWDLLAIGVLFVVVKMSLMFWYSIRD